MNIVIIVKGIPSEFFINEKLLAFNIECDGGLEVLAGKPKRMAELFPRLGASLIGLGHRLILTVPVLSEATFFFMFVTKPNISQHIQNIKLAQFVGRNRRNKMFMRMLLTKM